MMLYTMMPEELIFPTMEQEYSKHKVVAINGVSLLVNEAEQGEYSIVRVMSTDPTHFLDNRFSPGQKITMSAILP